MSDTMDRSNGVNEGHDDPEETRIIWETMDSFQQYARSAHLTITHFRRQAFYALPEAHWKMLAAPPFNYLDSLNRVDDAIDSNAELAHAMVRCGLHNFGLIPRDQVPTIPEEWLGVSKSQQDMEKARSTLRQFYRDWAAEGREEREASYRPVFEALETEKQHRLAAQTCAGEATQVEPLKVLVPGAGLGRLLFELCCLGYEVEGNELSYFSLIASSYLMNACPRAGAHTIYPWVHSFLNHKTRDDQLRSYAIPDVNPRDVIDEMRMAGKQPNMSMSASDFLCLYSGEQHANQWDAIASVFFLDTAPNVIRYLEVFWHCLRPGGVLINVGPLLWHWEAHVPDHSGYDGGDAEADDSKKTSRGISDPGSFELADDEVRLLVEKMGFVVEKWETGNHPTPYMQDMDSMMLAIYQASHWVARKPVTALQ